ncbi:tape measure protein [Bacteroides ovatus]|jgi:tape measure domain-containing protein|uniref:tape measure protein n=1 Tax=Bacteroides ovatus TaxID=28116 RepID=UPI000E4EAEC5|nr:tape measure protein [Bacteroides ovatus]KAA3971658.1 tape measure protein [Bacteroides ovatus]RHD30219.1 phage tail tape measure protein [Bacteroides ovatus]
MAKLYFKVASDWEEVVRLRSEIAKLKQELKNVDGTQSPATFKTLNTQLAVSNQKLDELVTNAAKAGAEMEMGFKKKIFDASQSVNGFTEKIITQKTVVKDIEADVKRLGESYRIALKRNPLSATGKLEEYNAARKALDEEKAALFGLTQQQAEARLSVKKLRDEYALYNDNAKEVVEKNNGIAISWKKALAVIGGAGVLKALGSEIIRVRGEFQSMQTAIETMVGKDMAGQLIPQIKELAKISPLTMSDMVGAEKMMLGFNIQAEDTIKYLKAISDISMGESSKFNSLTLAFSQMSAAGKLMGQDLNQMINAGFNPLQIISEKTGKSIATLKDEMSKGAVSAEMVQQAFIDATSAGGKFYNMSENASKTINGQLSMMQDALDSVFNELGTKSESVIMDGIQMTTSLIQNYETVGKVLAGLVVTYGTYRTAVMLVTAAESKHTLVEIGLTNARLLARKAQLALNAAMLTNPYVLLATAVVGLGVAMLAFRDSATEAEKAQRRFNEQQEEAKKQEEEHKQKIDSLVQSSRDIALSDLQRGRSLAELRKEYPKIFAQYDIETIKLADILKLKQQITEEDAKRAGEKQTKELSNIESEIKYYENLLKTLSGQQGVDGYVKKLKELRAMRDVMLQEKGKGISEQFISNLKDVNTNEFDRYISELEKRIRGKGENGTVKLRLPIDIKGTLSDEAIYNVKDIKTLIDTAKSVKQTRIDSEKNKTTYKQDYEKAKKDWEDAKKKLSEIEKDKSKFTSKQYEEAKKQKETTEKAYKDLGGITGNALSKQEKAIEKQKKDQQKSAEELLSLRRQNQQAEIDLMKEGTEKKLKQIDLDYQKELDAIKKQEKDLSERQGGKLTSEQSIEISARYTNAENKREKDIADVSKELNSILDKYRDYSAQRIAIEKQYQDDEKKLRDGLAKAKSDSEKKQYEDALKELEKQRKKTIDSISKSEIEDSGVWKMLMGDVDALPTDMLEQLLSDAEQLVKTTNLSATDMKAMMDTINNARQNLIARNPFKTLKEEYEKYQKAIKKGDKQGAFTSWSNVEQASESIKSNISTLGSSLSSLGTTFSDELGEGIQKAVDIINDGITAFEVFGKTGEKSAGDTVKGISGIVGIITTLVGTVMNAFDSTKAEQERNIEYQRRQEGYWDSINYQVERYLELLKEAAGNDYFATATQSLTTLEKAREKAYRDIVKSMPVGDVDAVTFGLAQLFKSGKFASKMTEYAFGGPQAKEIFDFIQANGGYDLQNKLISEEAIWAMKSNADIWSKLPEWMQQAIDKFVELNDQTKELEETLNEDLFQTTSQGLEEAILEGLKGGKRGIADFGEDFEEIMRNALLQSFVIDQLRGKAQEFYKKYTLLADSDENGKLDLTAEEISDLRKDWNDIIKAATEEAKNIDAIVGGSSSSSQEASKKGFATASQDSIDELNGRFTALQIAGEEIKNQSITQSQSLNILTMKADTLISINTETRNIADDTRDLIASSYLELVQISENTGAIIKPIQQMQKDMAEVKNNTKGLSTK